MSSFNRPVLVRRSTAADSATLAHLAARNGKRAMPRGRYLVAEVGNRVVAAAPLDDGVGPLNDRSPAAADVTELLTRWAANLRRHATEERRAA